MAKALTSNQGALWVQEGGPNTEPHYVGCVDVGDIAEPEGGIDLIRCFNPDGKTWQTLGQKITPPDKVTFTIDELVGEIQSYLDKVTCPFGMYILMRDCGLANIFTNYVRGVSIHDVRRASRTYKGLVKRAESAEAGISSAYEAWPPVIRIEQLTVDRQACAATQALNSITMNTDEECPADCNRTLEAGEDGLVVGDSAVAPALAVQYWTTNSGATWAAGAANPFAAGLSMHGAASFYVGRRTKRYLVSKTAPAAAQGQVAYSNNLGVAWSTVNIGGAAAGHGCVNGNGLWSLDMYHIWLASAAGYIYKSTDGGVTWTAVEAGTIHVGANNCIHFPDETYGICGGAGDVISLSDDGGDTWQVATATGGGGAILCCWRHDALNMWVGDDAGRLYYSTDGGVSWTQRIGWAGAGAGDVRSMSWLDRYEGFMAHDSAAPLGTVLHTIDGGYTWEALTTPTNAGLNQIQAVKSNLAYAVGELQGGTAVVLRISAV